MSFTEGVILSGSSRLDMTDDGRTSGELPTRGTPKGQGGLAAQSLRQKDRKIIIVF